MAQVTTCGSRQPGVKSTPTVIEQLITRVIQTGSGWVLTFKLESWSSGHGRYGSGHKKDLEENSKSGRNPVHESELHSRLTHLPIIALRFFAHSAACCTTC